MTDLPSGSITVKDLFLRYVQHRPLLLWFEDMQWTDVESQDVVESLVADLPGQTRWTASLSSPEVARALDEATVLVLPSRSEGLGRVIIEALCRSRPVIGSRVGGIADLIEDGVNGVLVPPRHPKEWAAAIGALLDDQPRRAAMSQRGLAKAQLYDWDHVVDEVLDVYRVARARASASTVPSSVHVQAPGVG